jgi:hypothetical protein
VPRIVAEFRGPQWQINAIVQDIDKLLAKEPFPFEELVHTANWRFKGEQKAKAFLKELREEITKMPPSDQPKPPSNQD